MVEHMEDRQAQAEQRGHQEPEAEAHDEAAKVPAACRWSGGQHPRMLATQSLMKPEAIRTPMKQLCGAALRA